MKKRNLVITALACSTLLLTSCNKITANLPNGSDKLTNATIEIDHNTLDTIYNTIKGGDNYAANVNDILTQAIAKSVLGEYKVVADKDAGYKIVLEGFDGKTNDEKQQFINSHAAYNDWESSSYKLKLSDTAPSVEDFTRRIDIIKGLIEEKIISTLWTEANATAYKRNNRFYEVLYARNLDEKLYSVTNPETGLPIDGKIIGAAPNYTAHYTSEDVAEFDGFNEKLELQGGFFTQGVLIDGSFDLNSDAGIENIKKVLHVGYYTDYINSSIMPSIMKNLLVEQFVLEQNYNAIGQTNSRKVNYISIANNADKDGDKFFKEFVSTYFTNANEENMTLSTVEKFGIASDAWKGDASVINQNEKTKALATAAFGAPTTKNPSAGLDGHISEEQAAKDPNNGYIQSYKTKNKIEYYKNTPYADLVEEYSTLTNDISTNNTANYDKFTTIDSNTYEPVVGLSIQQDAIKVNDYTTYGWETTDSSSLPEEIKNLLFSYGFVNEWNDAQGSDDSTFLGTYLYEVGNTGKYLLKTSKFTDSVNSVLWQNGGSYYIVEIEDVITTGSSQIYSDDNEQNKQTKDEKFAIEAKSRDVAYTIASGSTFTTNAMIHYLQQCNINYHDQDVYDYFVTTYPRLFE